MGGARRPAAEQFRRAGALDEGARAERQVAHPGVGSFGHLAGVLVAQELGATVTQVPYRGAGPALNDLLAGQVDMSSQSAVQSGPLVKAGKLKAYAIIGRSRFAGLPDLPTMGELGYKKLDIDFWHMLFAPAGTPRPIVDRLNAALRHALADATCKKTFADGGMDLFPPGAVTPEAAAALLKSELKLWGDVIRANNIYGAIAMRRTRALACSAASAACLPRGAAAAQTYPTRPITLIVPFPAGGATDAMARIRSPSRCRRRLGQQIVIEIRRRRRRHDRRGARRRARAPDGYTILIHQPGSRSA